MRSEGENKASFKDVSLNGAKITGQISLNDASLNGELDAYSLQVEGDLNMRSDAHKASFKKDVNLAGAKITGHIDMSRASFDAKLNTYALQVDNYLSIRGVHFVREVTMTSAHVGSNLDLRCAKLASLNLSGTVVVRDLQLASATWIGENGEPGDLNLRNTHIGNLMDAKDAWPEKYANPTKGHLRLDGFTFDHLGGPEGETGPKMRARGMEWWDNWARLDPDYSPAPYAQLAAAFTQLGDRDAANQIRFFGRVRERETQNGLAWAWSGILQSVAGFGIGTYTFRVLWWVLGISLIGALYLKTCVKGVRDGNHGLFWCLGASLARLLPIVEINKEFTEFFNDPERKRLTGRQSFVFSCIGIVGFVLGAILVAAAGLTQGS